MCACKLNSDLVACRNVVGPHLFSPSLTTLYRNRYTLTHKTSHHTALSLVPTTTIWASPFSQFFKSTRAWDCGKTKLMCVTARGMQQQQFDCRLFSDREARGTSKVLQRHELSSQNLLLHGKDTVQYLVPFGFFSTKDTINRQSNFSLLGWKERIYIQSWEKRTNRWWGRRSWLAVVGWFGWRFSFATTS